MATVRYYFGDAATQGKRLREQIALINHKKPVHEQIDADAAVLRMYRRVAKFYGLRNKYPAGKKEHNR